MIIDVTDRESLHNRMSVWVEKQSAAKKLPKTGKGLKIVLEDLVELIFGESCLPTGYAVVYKHSVDVTVEYTIRTALSGMLQARESAERLQNVTCTYTIIYYPDEGSHYFVCKGDHATMCH